MIGMIGALTMICMTSALSSVIADNVFSAEALTINKVPANVVKATISACDSDHTPMKTSAKVSVTGGKAKVDNLSETGYYYVTFYTDIAEVGSAEFFVGDSGKTYVTVYNEETSESFRQVSSLEYQEYLTHKLLDISGKNQVKFDGVSDDVSNAAIHASYEDGSYGDMETTVKVTNGVAVINNIGGKGDYNINFMDSSGVTQCFASFAIGKNGETLVYDYVFNETSGKWLESLVETDVIYVEEYDDYMSDIGGTEDSGITTKDVEISGTSKNIARAEVQATDSEMNEINVEPVISINSGSVKISNLYYGCYFVNFYDSSDDLIGFAKFYLDEKGSVYDFDIVDNELNLSSVSSVAYHALTAEKEYVFGNIMVPVYGVPEDIDSVETYYVYGNTADQVLLFEPDYSSIYVEPFTLGRIGQEGNYKVSFFRNGEVVGNAAFHIGKNGELCEVDYSYNNTTGEWEPELINTDEIYYYDNTDIEDSDDYAYGNIRLSITNVPADVKMLESSYYDSDNTYTYGCNIFPDYKIQNGVINITNLGAPGYHEFDLIKEDGITKVGYVYIWIDDNLNTYLYETYVNTDVMQLESKTTKTSSVKLTQYSGNAVDYVYGKTAVKIVNVPKTANNILVTVVTDDNQYSSFEQNINVTFDGISELNKLGMNGDYTVTFFTNNEILGSARFYLKDGGTYNAEYFGNYEQNLTKLSDITFTPNEDVTEYEPGDVDLNGKVTIADAVLLQKYLIGSKTFNASQYNIADMNSDGSVDVFDMISMRKILLKTT